MFNFRKFRFFKSIRTKMIVVFLATSLLTSMTSVFILQTSRNLIKKMDEMFSINVQVEEFLTIMDVVDDNLTNYLVSDDSDSVLNYHKQKDKFIEKAQSMFDKSKDVYRQDDLIYKDIRYMVEAYLVETDAAIEAKRLNDADEYIKRYAEADIISGYINVYIDRLNLSNLDSNTNQYLGMAADLSMLLMMNMILIVSVIIFNLFVIIYITYDITKPIVKLAHSAEEMSEGNFDAADIKVATHDELKVMATAFNGMKHSIKNYISDLHDKAQTEAQLFEQQVDNFKMKSLLDEAELKALQMQINPHFLFNTLNTGVQLAMIEGADRTTDFLEDIAKIFRYNVNSLDRVVEMKEEVDMVRAYGNMFQVRFGDTIKFEYEIDCDLFDIEVPPLIIQPFVENATIHGIGEKEEGGTIHISIFRKLDTMMISISDDGVGMDEKTRLKLIEGQKFDADKSGHTTGIGVSNVVHRLRLFFGVEDVLDIETKIDEGTKFILKIPIETEKVGS